MAAKRCNGLNMMAKRPNQRHIYPTKDTKEPLIEQQVNAKPVGDEEKKANDGVGDALPDSRCHGEAMQNPLQREYFSLDEFREDVMVSCASAEDPVVVVSCMCSVESECDCVLTTGCPRRFEEGLTADGRRPLQPHRGVSQGAGYVLNYGRCPVQVPPALGQDGGALPFHVQNGQILQ